MKKTLIASVAVLALVVGCSNKKKADPAVSSQGTLTDVAPPAPTSNANALPVNSAMPITPVDPTPAEGSTAGTPVAGQKYVVKQGETLWGIAKRVYGDGNQYKKIAQANHIKGTAIKAGQTLVLP